MRKLFVYLRNSNQKVGVFEQLGNVFTFNYDESYKGPTPLIYDRDEYGCVILNSGKIQATFDFQKTYSSSKSFFKEIVNNFPEGHTLESFVESYGFNPYDEPLRFLEHKKHDFYFDYVGENHA